jgi:hypothetical protein
MHDAHDPGEAAGDGTAKHGYRNEVSWDGGQGSQPYANQGEQEQGPATAGEAEAGNRGDASGRTIEQMDAAKREPERTRAEVDRDGRV